MTTGQQKSRERLFLAKMLELLPLEIIGEAVERERPDFEVTRLDGGYMGIEVVEIREPGAARGASKIRELKSELTKALHAAGLRVGLHFSVGLDASRLLDTKTVRVYTKAIVRLAEAAAREWVQPAGVYERRECEVVHESAELAALGLRLVASIRIWPRHELLVTRSSSGPGLRANLIQRTINDKAEKIDDYRSAGFAECWLLVVAGGGPGAAVDAEDAEDGCFTSPFEQTVFLDLFLPRCFFLSTSS